MSDRGTTPESRAEQAFRQAIGELEIPGEVDPRAARRHVQRRRGASLVAAAVVVLAGAVAVPQLLHSDPRSVPVPVAASETMAVPEPRASVAGAGRWRTEHYRDITFSVPAGWGYAYENADDCAPHTQKKGYVSLGRPRVSDSVGCAKSDGTAILDEHVAVRPLLASEPEVQPGIQQVQDWWVVSQVVDGLLVRAVSHDQALAERIVGSVARVEPNSGTLCPPHSVLENQPDARPSRPFDVAKIRRVDAITLCQYDASSASGPVISSGPVTSNGPAASNGSEGTDGKSSTGLAAQTTLQGTSAATLLSRIQQSPPSEAGACVRNPGPQPTDLVVVLYLQSGGEQHIMYVSAPGCSDEQQRPVGGFDDGTTVRQLSRSSCEALLVPPLRLEAATGGSAALNCVR